RESRSNIKRFLEEGSRVFWTERSSLNCRRAVRWRFRWTWLPKRGWSSIGPQPGPLPEGEGESGRLPLPFERVGFKESNWMSNLLFQTIDQISREKGIDPQIVVHAIEDAIVVASRKYFKSNEELKGRINSETGEIDVFALRKVVESVTNPVREISL